jgi:hypothetical protein
MVMDPARINDIYRLCHEEKWSLRRISRELHVARKSIRRYLRSPAARVVARKPRRTKLDSFKPVIREFMERDPEASAVVIAQRLEPLGYTGRLSILERPPAPARPVDPLAIALESESDKFPFAAMAEIVLPPPLSFLWGNKRFHGLSPLFLYLTGNHHPRSCRVRPRMPRGKQAEEGGKRAPGKPLKWQAGSLYRRT